MKSNVVNINSARNRSTETHKSLDKVFSLAMSKWSQGLPTYDALQQFTFEEIELDCIQYITSKSRQLSQLNVAGDILSKLLPTVSIQMVQKSVYYANCFTNDNKNIVSIIHIETYAGKIMLSIEITGNWGTEFKGVMDMFCNYDLPFVTNVLYHSEKVPDDSIHPSIVLELIKAFQILGFSAQHGITIGDSLLNKNPMRHLSFDYLSMSKKDTPHLINCSLFINASIYDIYLSHIS